jgi:hypothetical protein
MVLLLVLVLSIRRGDYGSGVPAVGKATGNGTF